MVIPPFLVSMAAQTAAQALPGLAEKLPDAMSKLYKDAGGGQAVKDLLQTGVGVATTIPKGITNLVGAIFDRGADAIRGNPPNNSSTFEFNIGQPKVAYKADQNPVDFPR